MKRNIKRFPEDFCLSDRIQGSKRC
ncbi:hypothetical protein [Lachnospira sp.]